jgi:hypothetical protein
LFAASIAFRSHLLAVQAFPPEGIDARYKLNEHGHLVYITREQFWLYYGLYGFGYGLVSLGVLLGIGWKIDRSRATGGI